MRFSIYFRRSENRLTFRKYGQLAAVVYCTHDNAYISGDELLIQYQVNGRPAGQYSLTATEALLAARQSALRLFLGPEMPDIDFLNETVRLPYTEQERDEAMREVESTEKGGE